MRVGNERGITLVETLVAVVISSIIMGALVQATVVGLRTVDNTNARLLGSNDTQLIASYFMTDIASSEFVSTTGTTAHAAPSVNGSAGGMLVSFFAIKTGTTVTPPDGMTGGWGIASTGPAVATRVTAAMADEPLTGAFPTGNRVANAANGSSSTTHSIALTASSTVARRDVSSGSTAGATSLTLSRPAATQPGDVLLAHFVVTGGTSTLVTPPPGWALVAGESVDSDAVTKSVVYTHAAAGGDPVGWAWTFNGSREAAGGIAAYSGASAVGSHQHDLNPCGGATPALVGTWTERSNDPAHPGEFLGVFNTVTYNFQAEGVENQLVRRHCTENSGIPVDSQTLARGLAPAASSVAGECDPIACVPRTSPVKVTLTLREAVPPGETVGRVYQLRGTTRANA